MAVAEINSLVIERVKILTPLLPSLTRMVLDWDLIQVLLEFLSFVNIQPHLKNIHL
jgi:hypothetical protein